MSRRRALAALAVVLAASPMPAQQPAGQVAQGFPHEKHAKLFPTCASCHIGIERGDASRSYPSVQQCETCHNGRDAARVGWRPATRPAGNLKFSHPAHQRVVSPGDSAGCQTCHGRQRQGAYMDVGAPRPETCFACHSHRATSHYADDNRCSTCHRPLVEATGFTVERIARLPKPPSHDRADFISTHEPRTDEQVAQCATCHARESCARCHVNARTLATITALGADARVASLVRGRAPSYPEPSSHRDPDFIARHGAMAASDIQNCSTCHARPSCQACHLDIAGPRVQSINRVPMPERGLAPGVRLERQRNWTGHADPLAVPASGPAATPLMSPAMRGSQGASAPQRAATQDTARQVVRVHPPNFTRTHGPAASTQELTCENCHAKRYCTECHSGEGKRRFHPVNFVQRHAPESWGRETDCAKCHNAQVFCRGCHVQTGLASNGRLDAAYHTGQPQWLLQHGRAARQGLQSCTTCHTQKDCLQCHSQAGWGVSPHGPDFDAKAMSKRAKSQCFRCHITDPLAGR